MYPYVADYSQERGFLKKIEQGNRIAEHIAHPQEPMGGLDIELHVVDPQIVTFSRPQYEAVSPEGHRPFVRISRAMSDSKPKHGV